MKNKIIEKLSSIDTFNIKVVGGLEQPIIPEEGLIWVKTQSITFNYILSSTQPKDNNLIWIELDATGVPLKINQSGTLAVGLKACQFYKDNIWNNVDAWVYTGGKWLQFSQRILIVYADGKLADGFTILQPMPNDPTPSSPVYTNISMQSDRIAAMGIDGLWGIVFNPAVNISTFKTLEIEFDTNQSGVCWTAMGISPNNKWVEGGLQMDVRHYTQSIVSKTKISLDISSVAGNKYIKIYGFSQNKFNVNVYRVELK